MIHSPNPTPECYSVDANAQPLHTSDATATTLFSKPVGLNETLIVQIHVVCRTATSTKNGAWSRTYVWDRLATGNVEVDSASSAWATPYYASDTTVAGPLQAVDTVNQKALITVTGLSGTDLYWKYYAVSVIL